MRQEIVVEEDTQRRATSGMEPVLLLWIWPQNIGGTLQTFQPPHVEVSFSCSICIQLLSIVLPVFPSGFIYLAVLTVFGKSKNSVVFRIKVLLSGCKGCFPILTSTSLIMFCCKPLLLSSGCTINPHFSKQALWEQAPGHTSCWWQQWKV